MARSLKDAGIEELGNLKKRVNRQHTLERIHLGDRERLVDMIDQLSAYIIEMDEKEEKGGFIAW